MKNTNKTTKKVSNHQLIPNGTTVDLGLALTCDTAHRPDSLLGDGFLSRGGGGLLIGQSAVGKSTFAFQMACHLGAGKDFFGIKSSHKGPLKVLLVQSENDAIEIAEVVQSVTEHWPASEVNRLKSHLVVEIIWDKLGEDFGKWLRNAVATHNPDLVIVDPLLGFLGDDVSNNQAVTNFLRTYVNGVLKNPPAGCQNFGLIFVHHTGKPAANGKKDEKATSASRIYNLMGASELANWARCIMRLDAAPEKGWFQFFVPKRGDRSGVPYNRKEEEWGCLVRHSLKSPTTQKRVLRWELAEAPAEQTAAPILDEELSVLPIKPRKSSGQNLPEPTEMVEK